MFEVNIKEDWLIRARKEAENLGVLANSITKGRGNVYGFLGEIIISEITEAEIQRTYDYDLVLGAKRIDVKTKRCTSRPLPHYYCSLAAFNIQQQCDYYTFVRVMEDFSKAWILGIIEKKLFFKLATFNRKGEVDASSSVGWRFKADCYNLKISQLGM